MGWIIFILSVTIIGGLAYFSGDFINASVRGKVIPSLKDWIAPIVFIGGAFIVSIIDTNYFVIWLFGGFIGMFLASRIG